MQGKFLGGPAECCDEVVFPCLDSFLCKVATVVIWWDKLICHARVTYGLFVGSGGFIVEVACGCKATNFHSLECPCSGEDHFTLTAVFGCFHPNGVAVDMV